MTNTIRVSCDRKNLRIIRTFVTDTLAPVHLSEITLNQIILAVDEICANLIIHANKEDTSQFLTLSIEHEDNELVFKLIDNGKAFEQANYREPNIQENIRQGKKGGVGVALVNRIMDKVEYAADGPTNICILHKYIR
jgi:serine/threonine-protein kinase RsbW